MKCVKCGNATEVADSRKFDTVVWRRRSCRACGHRVNTHETVVEIEPKKPRLSAPRKPKPKPSPRRDSVPAALPPSPPPSLCSARLAIEQLREERRQQQWEDDY